MGYRTRRPTRMAGALVNSGSLDTGEIQWANGGQRRFTAYSGGLRSLGSGTANQLSQTVDHVVLWSGAGRLKTIVPHQSISGVSIVAYDSVVVGRSGPGTYAESGYAVLAAVPQNTFLANGTLGGPMPITYDTPFFSGLCVVGASGVPGFTVTWTPEAFRSGLADDTIG